MGDYTKLVAAFNHPHKDAPAMDIYLNGQMTDPARALISVDDAGFQHAVGLFETMNVHHGRPFRLRAHLDRLAHSATTLGMLRHPDLDALERAVEQTIAHNQLDRARLRLTVTAGRVSLLGSQTPTDTPAGPSVLVVPSEPTVYDPAYFEQGVTVMVGPPAANPFDPMAGHKTLAYWARLMTLRQAASAGAGEVIWLNATRHLASGAVSNLFLVKDGQLLTPIAHGEEAPGALPAPVLPGVTRAAVVELAGSMKIEVTRKMLDINDLLDADEVFLTNSGWYILPVTRVEKKAIGEGGVGPMTSRLRQALLEQVERETTPSA